MCVPIYCFIQTQNVFTSCTSHHTGTHTKKKRGRKGRKKWHHVVSSWLSQIPVTGAKQLSNDSRHKPHDIASCGAPQDPFRLLSASVPGTGKVPEVHCTVQVPVIYTWSPTAAVISMDIPFPGLPFIIVLDSSFG